MTAPTTPISRLAERLITDVAVSVRITLSSRRRTPPAKTCFFALLGVIALDDANAAERLRQAAGHLGVDFAALPENGPDGAECLVQRDGEAQQEAEGQHGHHRADAKQDHQRNAGSEQSADQIDQPSPQQVPDAFDVGHDARNQSAGLVGVVESYRQMRDVGLYFLAKFGNQPLCCFG